MLSDDLVRPPGLLGRAFERLQSVSRSSFGRNALWLTSLTGFERLIAVVQAALVSRAMGITEYGVFMLLFPTIGLVASSVALQMGLVGTVFVSKYRDTEKAKAAAVISVVTRFAWLVSAVVVVAALPAYGRLSQWLLGSGSYQVAIMLAIVFVGATVISGVQDGVAQGFEMFVPMVKLKIAVALPVLASIYPVARGFGLNGVMGIILAGVVIKYVVLEGAISRRRLDAGLPARGSGVSFRAIVGDFALPSMVVTLLIGVVTWLGTFLLSKQPGGLDQVAIASTGLQWRGPVLLLTASFGGVAIPAFSRLSASGDTAGSRRLFRRLVLVNLLIATVVALLMTAASGLIMTAYGTGFAQGRLAFCLIVLSTIPSVIAGVYLQQLVGSARMWRQLWLHVPCLIALSASFNLLVPRYHAAGYGASLLIGAIVLLVQLAASDAARHTDPTRI
ncbi:MAG TPA: oligosaccharide flippase family protein [Vicinamibacterales bacterium]|nr:oligosaccharide flippase family protein [Vicinamibacterales bacterium]